MQEELWQVNISDTDLQVSDPNKNVRSMQLSNIRGIAIQTNNSGPLGSDVIWLISDGDSTISFPLGASGENSALRFFQTLDGFDNLKFINAMSSTDNNVFILFKKTEA